MIEVGENMKPVCKRFTENDMGEKIANRMDVPEKFIKRLLREKQT